MSEAPKKDDEKQRDEILRRMLKTPPKPHKVEQKPKDESSEELPKKP